MQQAYHYYQYAQPATVAPVSQMTAPMATAPQTQQMSMPANHPLAQFIDQSRIMKVNLPANHPIIQLLTQPQPQLPMQKTMTPQKAKPEAMKLQ